MFHVQNEIVKGTSGSLSKKTTKAQKNLEKASEKVNRCIDKKVAYDSKKPGPGRPPQFNKKIEGALLEETKALQAFYLAESNQARMKQAIRNIGVLYHPVDLETGKLKSSDEVSNSLDQCFAEIETVATEAELSTQSLKRIKKAKNVLPSMIATIAFFYFSIRQKIMVLSLSPAVEKIMYEMLIPAFYLRNTAQKAKTADTRSRLKVKSDELWASYRCMQDTFSEGAQEELTELENIAKACANMFQRSSSCVEGRNGQLSLRHHSFHRLSNRKLSALTAVHNFFIKRMDGTTAAERFFDNKPRDMFEFILETVSIPGRPAKKRMVDFGNESMLAGV